MMKSWRWLGVMGSAIAIPALAFACSKEVNVTANGSDPDAAPVQSAPPVVNPDTAPPPQVVTVSGRAIAGFANIANGGPIVGARVIIAGKEVKTGADGGFSIPNVTTPYDAILIVKDTNGLGTTVDVFQGLTRPDPVLNGGPGFLLTGAIVKGAVSGMSPQYASGGTLLRVAVGNRNTTGNYTDIPSSGAPTYLAGSGWPKSAGSQMLRATAMELEMTDAGLPGVFLRYAKSAPFQVDVAPQGEQFDAGTRDLTLGQYGNASLATTAKIVVESPDDQVTGVQLVYWIDDVKYFFGVPAGFDLDGGVPFPIPQTGSADVLVLTQSATAGYGSFAKRNITGAGTVTITAKKVTSVLTKPGAGDSIGPGSVVEWGATAGSIYKVSFGVDVSAGGPPFSVSVVTGATSVTLPDLAALGVPFPTGATVGASVTTMGPRASVDVFCVPGAYVALDAQTSSSPITLKAK
jgi:hypothetical protein